MVKIDKTKGEDKMNTNFRKINSQADLREYDKIWKAAWKEKKFPIEENVNADKYGILENDKIVGTMELSIYDELSSTENIYRFSKEPIIQMHKGEIGLIDKVSIQKNNRGKLMNMMKMIQILENYVQENPIKYFVALMEPRFFETLTRFCHMSGKPFANGKTFDGELAVYFDVEESYKSYVKHPLYEKLLQVSKR